MGEGKGAQGAVKVGVEVEVPEQAKAWLKRHDGSEGSEEDFRRIFKHLLEEFLKDLEEDYGRVH
jgi:hypothetical protein